ncbi:hypothetical protein PHLCEN_2v13122 [Hermanssonia centrifuga]|uniref:Uncharacterized protein n=1 Tax=Hermanssonia centrifuga TaxID=98765 RepID=A0A2R6NFI0_9APHY|nr:hypothetical protein PHLCEN_2v13122 [Hermanssonia centrifuga]
MLSMTHAQETYSVNDLLATAQHLNNSLRTTQKWDVRDDRTTAALVKCRKGLPLLRPDHPMLTAVLLVISETLSRRFEALGEIADINDSIIFLGESLTISPSSQDGYIDDEDDLHAAALSLNVMGDALTSRFMHSKNSEDVDAAIDNYRMALALSSPDNPTHLQRRMELANVLFLRFNEHGRREDLDEFIQLERELVSSSETEPDEDGTYRSLALRLIRLGNLLALRYTNSGMITFKAKGQIEDIDGAIDRLREAIACLSGGNDLLDEGETHGSLAPILNLLGDLLISRHRKLGLIVDLEQATESYEKALALLPNNDERRPRYLRDLAGSLRLTFREKGQIEDLDGAIDRMREALACLSNGIDPADKGETCISLGFLARFLDARFRCTGERADLDEAIRCRYQAMELDPTKRYSALDNLSNHFFALYLVTRDVSGLE